MAVGDKIQIADKQTVDAVNASVGSNTDASSATGSVHAKLKDVKAQLGNQTDAANITGNLQQKTSFLTVNVGSNADSASATGSVHAKLKDIKANLGGGGYNALNMRSLGGEYTPTYSLQTLFSITGKGLLYDAYVFNSATSSGEQSYIEISVDNTVIFKGYAQGGSGSVGQKANGIFNGNKLTVFGTGGASAVYVGDSLVKGVQIGNTNFPSHANDVVSFILNEPIAFNSSVIVKGYTSITGIRANYRVNYILT